MDEAAPVADWDGAWKVSFTALGSSTGSCSCRVKDNRLVRQEIEADEKDKQMPYITSFAQIAVEDAEARGAARGEARGRAEGQKYGIAVALRIRFGQVGEAVAAEIQQLNDPQKINQIAESIETIATIDDLRRLSSA